MNDIWDEKPDAWHETDKRFYPALEMDAWLENLKAEWDAPKKLEAIKEYFEERSRGDIEVLWVWNDIKEILESSEFVHNSEEDVLS